MCRVIELDVNWQMQVVADEERKNGRCCVGTGFEACEEIMSSSFAAHLQLPLQLAVPCLALLLLHWEARLSSAIANQRPQTITQI